jgi:ferric-dicitrate binding protein FerR (iron transport regulator)
MDNNQQFAELLNAYLEGKATPEEYLQLIGLIKSSRYDDYLKQQIDEFLLQENTEVDLDSRRANELLNSILNSEKHTAKLIRITRPVRRSGRRMAITAAAILIAALAMWWLLPHRNLPAIKGPGTALAKKDNSAAAPDSKGKKYIHLKDGSTVLLNEGSQLEYAETFNTTTREVTLRGEAYFEIHHDGSRPFIVHTGKVNTTVLGTAFNIKAYPDQKEVTVTVTRGRVKVSEPRKSFGIATPNESIAVNTEENTSHQGKVDAEQVVGWKKECLVLDNISLEDAAILIDSRYHVTISFANAKLKECRISATFLNNENLEQVLTVVSGVVNATYTVQPNDQVIMSGAGCI